MNTLLEALAAVILAWFGYLLVVLVMDPNSQTSVLSFEESHREFLEDPYIQEDLKFLIAAEKGSDANKLRLIVTDSWHSQHYQTRLQGAHFFWRAWAKSRRNVRPFWIEIELVDRAGNVVGGSSGWAILGDKRIWVTSYDRLISP